MRDDRRATIALNLSATFRRAAPSADAVIRKLVLAWPQGRLTAHGHEARRSRRENGAPRRHGQANQRRRSMLRPAHVRTSATAAAHEAPTDRAARDRHTSGMLLLTLWLRHAL
jgi:hypothetical protein